jgi:hypothetical protein
VFYGRKLPGCSSRSDEVGGPVRTKTENNDDYYFSSFENSELFFGEIFENNEDEQTTTERRV